MLAIQLRSPFNLDLTDVPLRILGPEELLIKVGASGVCGTDFHIFSGEARSKYPVIPGHEFSGTVIDTGAAVENIKQGDKVAVDPNITCGKCYYCRRGEVNFCENLTALGVDLDGGFADCCIVPVSQAYLLPDDVSLDYAAFAEPLSCCIRGIDRAQIKQGETTTVIGGGTIGLLMVQLCKAAGSSNVILIEPVKEKQNLGFRLGADLTFSPFDENLLEKISDLTHGGSDTVVECAGSIDSVKNAFALIKRGGKVILFGLAPKNSRAEIDLQAAFYKEISIKTSFLNPFTFHRAVNLITSKRINVSFLSSKFKNLSDIKKMFYSDRDDKIIKCQFINQ